MKTKYLWLIKLWLKWINFYIPIKLILKRQHLIKNDSYITTEDFGLTRKGKYRIFKLFWTQEQLEDFKKMTKESERFWFEINKH